jgi:hypothetical protein
MQIRDGNFGFGMEKIRIRDKHSGSATLESRIEKNNINIEKKHCFSYVVQLIY